MGWAVGGLAQREAYSSTQDDISDLGAMTASSPWLYNQIGSNLTGLLIVVLALGFWRALAPDTLGRLGAGALLLVGVGVSLDGLFRLDCQGIDMNCQNDSWHSDAHKMECASPWSLPCSPRSSSPSRSAGSPDGETAGCPLSPSYRSALASGSLLRLRGRRSNPSDNVDVDALGRVRRLPATSKNSAARARTRLTGRASRGSRSHRAARFCRGRATARTAA